MLKGEASSTCSKHNSNSSKFHVSFQGASDKKHVNATTKRSKSLEGHTDPATQQKDQETLVGGFEPWNFSCFPYIGNVIIPTDELLHFSEGLNHQPELVFL